MKFLEVRLYSRRDLTDTKLLGYIDNSNFTIQDYSNYLNKDSIYSSLSEKVMEFFLGFENGFLTPEKCDVGEPVREKFSVGDIDTYIRWISQPGGAFFFKKSKPLKVEGVIENHNFQPIFESGKMVKPKTALPYYLTEIKVFIEVKVLKLRSSEFLLGFLKALGKCIDADFGFITTEEEVNSLHFIGKKQGGSYEGMNANLYLTGIYWINYLGKSFVDLIGETQLKALEGMTSSFALEDECVFSLAETAASVDPELRTRIVKLLGEQYFFDKTNPRKKGVLPKG